MRINVIGSLRDLQFGKKIALLMATVSMVTVLGAPVAVSAQSNSQSQSSNNSYPTSNKDCKNWQSYSHNFESRKDCKEWVKNHNNNGYGGGGGGGGGGLGGFFDRLFSFLNHFFHRLFSFFGGWF